MKKLFHALTLPVIASAAILCLSTDGNGIPFASKENAAGVLYQTTRNDHKSVIELCPDGESYYTTCTTGSGSCVYTTCPPTTEEM